MGNISALLLRGRKKIFGLRGGYRYRRIDGVKDTAVLVCVCVHDEDYLTKNS
jgi:hypothetical protein